MQALASALYFILIGACDYAMAIAELISSVKSSPVKAQGSNPLTGLGAAGRSPASSGWGLALQADKAAQVRLRELEERVTSGLTKAGLSLGAGAGARAMVRAQFSQADMQSLPKLHRLTSQLPKELLRVVEFAVGNITAAAEVREGHDEV